MTLISYAQLQALLTSVAKVVPDSLTCDGCLELVGKLAEAERRGDELSEALQAVQVHFSQCPCCANEYETLLEALNAADEPAAPESEI